MFQTDNDRAACRVHIRGGMKAKLAQLKRRQGDRHDQAERSN